MLVPEGKALTKVGGLEVVSPGEGVLLRATWGSPEEERPVAFSIRTSESQQKGF